MSLLATAQAQLKENDEIRLLGDDFGGTDDPTMDAQYSCRDSVVRGLPRAPLKECLLTVKDSGVVLPQESGKKSKTGNNGNGRSGKCKARFKQDMKRRREEEVEDEEWENPGPLSVSAPPSPRVGPVVIRVTPPGSPLPPRAQDVNGVVPGACDIRCHFQSMIYRIMRPEDTFRMAVKLESVHKGRTRYLDVVSWDDECILLGVDCRTDRSTSIGLCLKLLADTVITLDGDGGFRVSTAGRHHFFKPVSVQVMWSVLQTLYKFSGFARERNYFVGGGSHEWAKHYESDQLRSDISCVNEWNAMDDLESRRPPSPDAVLARNRPDIAQRQETEMMIRTKLKEIMMSVDLDEVNSKYLRVRLEREMDTDLAEYKSFIDEEIITILGQMDQATEIFPYLYLGSEWNASNREELERNGITHILNVTREIDNFFPNTFVYQNVRVYDDEATQLLKYWEDTYKFIKHAREGKGKVLVHCKMGISRSASVVVAYVMKSQGWTLKQSQDFVKSKRTCVKPNGNFLQQLKTYEGILDASKQRHNSLWRSVSESHLGVDSMGGDKLRRGGSSSGSGTAAKRMKNLLLGAGDGSEKSDGPRAQKRGKKFLLPKANRVKSPESDDGWRPKSWSPSRDGAGDKKKALRLKTESSVNEDSKSRPRSNTDSKKSSGDKRDREIPRRHPLFNVRLFRNNQTEESYAVSPNKVMHLDNPHHSPHKPPEGIVRSSSVKDRIFELESGQQASAQAAKSAYEDLPDQTGLVQILANQFEKKVKSGDDIPSGQQTYSAKVVLKQSLRHRDPFSAQVDKVFDREERKTVTVKQRREEVSGCLGPVPGPGTGPATAPVISVLKTECPSRQSSFGSVDSAIGILGSENPSRQSSWGSCDTSRVTVTPSPSTRFYIESQGHKRRGWPPDTITEPESESTNPGVVHRLKRELEEKKKRSASVPKFGSPNLMPSPRVPERKSSLECLSKSQIEKCDNVGKVLPEVSSPTVHPMYGTL